nr:hypothetical protein [Tanacetum cinerariifolium]
NINEEVYVCQPLGFEDPDYPDKVYKVVKVVKALYGLHQTLRAWYETLATYLLENAFQRGEIDQILFIKKQKGLQVKQKDNGIFISQDKYVAEILRKFGLTDGKSASTPIDTEKPLLKDPDIKRIFRYLKGKPYLGLWYPKDSSFNLVAYSDSDYARAILDKKSTIREEPKRVHQALKDYSWIEVMQEELLQFKMQKVWILVDLPKGKRAIGSKWVFRNKKDERAIIIRNKA